MINQYPTKLPSCKVECIRNCKISRQQPQIIGHLSSIRSSLQNNWSFSDAHRELVNDRGQGASSDIIAPWKHEGLATVFLHLQILQSNNSLLKASTTGKNDPKIFKVLLFKNLGIRFKWNSFEGLSKWWEVEMRRESEKWWN